MGSILQKRGVMLSNGDSWRRKEMERGNEEWGWRVRQAAIWSKRNSASTLSIETESCDFSPLLFSSFSPSRPFRSRREQWFWLWVLFTLPDMTCVMCSGISVSLPATQAVLYGELCFWVLLFPNHGWFLRCHSYKYLASKAWLRIIWSLHAMIVHVHFLIHMILF